ncbi:MAG: SMP-30/gluconolactonase/LRE family protein [Betaproteobacteria bacterium]
MRYGVPNHLARLYARLPHALHWQGPSNDWVRATRPGLSLHSFIEGLALASDGTAYLADVPYGRVFRIDAADRAWTCVLNDGSEPHGLWLETATRMVIVDHRHGLRALDLDTLIVTPRCEAPTDGAFHGLSDLAIDGDGAIWFTDPGRSSLSDPYGRLFRLSPTGELTVVLERLPYPNGVAITPDGKDVLVAMTRANAVWKLSRTVAASALPMLGHYLQLSGGLGPDGLAIGAHGCLAVAHAQAGCAWLYDATGTLLARIAIPDGMWTTSVRFAPWSPGQLFIAEAQTGSIYEFDCTDILEEHA